MIITKISAKILFVLLVIFCGLANLFAQEPVKSPTLPAKNEDPKDEVVRINTNLIQTGVTVLDKKGQFVNNLTQEDFDLRVDGKPVQISFFEQITGSTPKSNNQTNTGKNTAVKGETATAPVAGKRSRKIIFVLDNSHQSFDSLRRTKDLIIRFFDRGMAPDDLVAIYSTGNKSEVVQPFTSDKIVLRSAVEKIAYLRNRAASLFNPPMSEYDALLIDRRESETTEIFVNNMMQQNPEFDPDTVREQVRSLAKEILSEAGTYSQYTYFSLEKAVRSSLQTTGRKIVLLFSDGFLLDLENTDASQRLQSITDAAARANAAIYSFDTRGLEAALPENVSRVNTGISMGTGSQVAASSNPSARRNSTATALRVQAGERFEAQDGMNVLADSTGGRLISNTNDLQTEMNKALAESSVYYLLTWQPDPENDKSGKLKNIQVSVKAHPELKIRVQKGYLSANSGTAENKNAENADGKKLIAIEPTVKPALSIAEQQLNNAVSAQATRSIDLPATLAVNYLDTAENGTILAAVLKIKADAVEFTAKGEETTANIDLLGALYNSAGQRQMTFKKLITVSSNADPEDRADIYYNYQTKLNPGVYQLRIAVRDVKSGRMGNDVQTIEIPDLSLHKLNLSSLLLSESAADAKPRQTLSDSESALGEVALDVEHQFESSSTLRYLIFVYNAARGQDGQGLPNVTIQTQILRGETTVLTTPERPIAVEDQDAARLPYAGEISLETLAPGHYEIRTTVKDRIAKTSAVQRLPFEVQ